MRWCIGIVLFLIGTLHTFIQSNNAQEQQKWALLVFLDGAEGFNPTVLAIIKQFAQVNSCDCPIGFVWRVTEHYACFYWKQGNRLIYQQSLIMHDADAIIAKSLVLFFGKYPDHYHAVLIAGHGYGIMHNNRESMLNYHNLIQGFKTVFSNTVCPISKIDLLCLDACMMAIMELLYELKDFVCYAIASQACEPLAGLNYKKLVKYLNKPLKPEKVCQKLVHNYQQYCLEQNPLRPYTLSAIALVRLEPLKRHFDALQKIIHDIKKTKEYAMVKAYLKIACSWALVSKSLPVYSDIKTFSLTLSTFLKRHINKQISAYGKCLLTLLQEINDFLEQIIICSCASDGMQAYGLSFYNASFSRFG